MAVILYIEDEVSFRTAFSNLLEKAGHSVVLADNGLEARKMIEQWRMQVPDLVITDHRMPGLTGFELVKLLRHKEAFRDTPIVVLTAVSGQVRSLEGEQKVTVIDKLTRLDDILAAIGKIVESLPKKIETAVKPLEIKRSFY